MRSGFWVLIILVSCSGLCGIGSVSAENRRPKNVQVSVQAKWSGTPLLLEAGYVITFLFYFILFFGFEFCGIFVLVKVLSSVVEFLSL